MYMKINEAQKIQNSIIYLLNHVIATFNTEQLESFYAFNRCISLLT